MASANLPARRRYGARKPIVPPRRQFADAAHYAAFLYYLDGCDRLAAARFATCEDDRIFYACWALTALSMAENCIRGSRAGQIPTRPEYLPENLVPKIAGFREEAALMIPPHLLARPSVPIVPWFGSVVMLPWWRQILL